MFHSDQHYIKIYEHPKYRPKNRTLSGSQLRYLCDALHIVWTRYWYHRRTMSDLESELWTPHILRPRKPYCKYFEKTRLYHMDRNDYRGLHLEHRPHE